MLAYLDSLIAALALRDGPDIERLLTHPLARILPEDARNEAEALRDGAADPLAAPLRVMQLRHQTAELLRADRADTVKESSPSYEAPRVRLSPRRVRKAGQVQMELALSA